MKRNLMLKVVLEPDPDAQRLLDEALDLLANALADLFIARAKADVMAAHGISPRGLALNFNPLETEDLDS